MRVGRAQHADDGGFDQFFVAQFADIAILEFEQNFRKQTEL